MNALVMLIVGVLLIALAGLLPAPLPTVAYVVGVILAVVGGVLLLVALIRGVT